MPINLKDGISAIRDGHQINESGLMRKAIIQFIEHIKRNPERTSRCMVG